MTDVFDWPVPCEQVVDIGDDTQTNTMSPGVFEHPLHDAALAGRGNENLVDEVLASMLKERVKTANDII